ncbi:MAG: hypothetical protein ACFB2X_05345 [Rivularia sp. (in: cyanobacteria)]
MYCLTPSPVIPPLPVSQALKITTTTNTPRTFHYFNAWMEYIDATIEPTLIQMTRKLGKNLEQLKAGLEFWRSIPKQLDSAASITVYEASGIR